MGNFVDLGVSGVKAIKLAYQKVTPRIFGVLEICAGSSCSSDSTKYSPTGTELALIIATIDTTYLTVSVKHFYIESYFSNMNFGITRRSLDFTSQSQQFFLTFQDSST